MLGRRLVITKQHHLSGNPFFTSSRSAIRPSIFLQLLGLINITPRAVSNSSIAAPPLSSIRTMSTKSDQEWRAVLSPEQFRVLRQKGTEMAGSGEYLHNKDAGIYNCAACDSPLYKSTTKFDSGCGWPAFYDAIPGAIHLNKDTTMGMTRTEMVCANCGGHLGHVFYGEGFKTPTDARHCVNSVSLKFKKE